MNNKKSDLIRDEILLLLEKYSVCEDAAKLIIREVDQLCDIADGEEENYFNWKGE